MIRLKIEWGNEEVYPISELVKRADFPIKRDRDTIVTWIREGVGTARGSRLAFPAFILGNAYHSSVAAARAFIVVLAKKSAEAPMQITKARKKRAKVVKPVQSDSRMRRVN